MRTIHIIRNQGEIQHLNVLAYKIFILTLLVILASCSPSSNSLIDQSNTSNLEPILYLPINPTKTATPFQPVPPTPTFIPTEYVSKLFIQTQIPQTISPLPEIINNWGSYPGPSVYPPISIPPPMGIITQPSDQTNILIMGSDQRPYEGGYRTDVILLLTLNISQGTAVLTSFPRDLYVYIPGWTMERINTAQARGGFQLTAQTFEYNFGVRPDHWVLINFSGFTSVINALGGINVQVSQTLSDTRDGYGYYTVPAGTFQMDGETALWYVRSRGTSNDFDRTRRQQEVLQAIFYKVISLDGITRAPELYGQYQSAMITDLSIQDILPLLPLASQLATNNKIYRYSIGPAQVTPWTNPYSGAQVLLPIREAILSVMLQALSQQ